MIYLQRRLDRQSRQLEDAPCILTHKVIDHFRSQATGHLYQMLVCAVHTGLPGQLGEVCAEQDLCATGGVGKSDELLRVVFGQIGRGVDVDVVVLPCDGDHLGGPRIADVATDDLELGELEGDGVDIGDRTTGLTGAQRARMADLSTEGDVEFDAFDVQGPVVSVGGSEIPQPRHNAKSLEAFLDHIVLELLDRAHGIMQVHRRQPKDPIRICSCELGHVFVGTQDLARSPP